MHEKQEINFCLEQIFRITKALAPENNWSSIYIEGYIVGSITEVKSWYVLQNTETRIEFETFDLDYINEDTKNNNIGNFIEKLRELTYHPNKGAWYTISIEYTQNNKPLTAYNYSDIPAFEEPLPLAIYKKDLKLFPRPTEAIPSWLV
ncbi:hypothetical protein HNQ93_002620 [Hymenobacter luteus]|uniref:DUF600 family protein n=2 Tax=Hymenobacter TaxID=89966 RepID=A0A7W9T2G9_9BACT|nr:MULTISPECIES: immunity protein YezG family protein [Hymenobacter]MBB4601811.1 hypothetical protein [Hymenobacter latericoloratus]MBB6059760.1 hypothetical protein [Hymenobacter luteus]